MNSAPTVALADVLTEVKTELGARPEPPILTLTEGRGFVLQSEKFKKRVATSDTSRYRLLARGDISFNPYLLWAGALAENDLLDEAITSPVYPTFRSSGDADSRYIWHLLRSPDALARFDAISFGSIPRRRRASVKDFLATRIPMPSLQEQRRIAAILDQADELRAKRRRTLALLDETARTAFEDIIGWDRPMARVDEVATTRLGKMLDAKKQNGHASAPYLRNANVQWFRFELEDLRTMEFSVEERVEFSLRPGDVLVCEGGQPGRCAIWEGALEKVFFQKALHRVRTDKSVVRPEVFAHTLRAMHETGRLADSISQATIAHLTGDSLRALRIPIAPMATQDAFVMQLAAIGALRKSAEEHLAHLDELFASLQHRAFTGQL